MVGINPKGVPYRVLVIDDLAFMTKQLGLLLTAEGFVVAGTAADGDQGVTLYKTLYPNVDLVTLDITMPGIDGISALERILEFDKQAKVIMISALGNEDIVKKCILMGAKSYVLKPLDRENLVKRLAPIFKR